MNITGVGPLAITGRISAASGIPVGRVAGNGYTIYDYAVTRTFKDVTCNGTSLKSYEVIEVGIKDGYGYVMTAINPVDGTSYQMPDQTWLTYTSYGQINIV